MIRKFIFSNNEEGTEILLPVTPEAFAINRGNRVETINMHSIGDISLCGNPTLASLSIDCLFPSQQYTFAHKHLIPLIYIETFKRWVKEKSVLRFIVSSTDINLAVLVNNFSYGERDGTNDVYATIDLLEYRELAMEKTVAADTGNKARTVEEEAPQADTVYTIKAGDTLSAICRDYYNDAALYPQLAAYNSIANPHLIYTGNTLKIPDKSRL